MTKKPVFETRFDELTTSVYQTNDELGMAAAEEAVDILNNAIRERGEANLILATGNSQLTFLKALRTAQIAWSDINIFHMDEYVGLDPTHPASFPSFLRAQLVSHIQPKEFFPIPPSTQQNAEELCRAYEQLLVTHPADLCVLGIGENGHLAFNDPPFADFKTSRLVKIVELDLASRRQQVREGHFMNIDHVPTHAITLTIPALLAARHVLALVPEARKAEAVYRCLLGPISKECPGSILRQCQNAHLFLDSNSAQKVLPRVPGV